MKSISFKQFIPGIIWFIIVFISIALPRNDIPKGSEWIDLILDFDKMIHGAMFGLLALLFMIPFLKEDFSILQRKRIFISISIATCCWGYITECIQLFVPGRSYDLVDWTADCLGVLLTYILLKLYVKKKEGVKN